MFERGDRFPRQDVLPRRHAHADDTGMILERFFQLVQIDAFDIAAARCGQKLREFAGEAFHADDLERWPAGIFGQRVDRLVDKHGATQIVQRHGQHGQIDRKQHEHHRDGRKRCLRQFSLGIDRGERQDREQCSEGQPCDRDLDQAFAQPAIDQPYAEIARREREHQ